MMDTNLSLRNVSTFMILAATPAPASTSASVYRAEAAAATSSHTFLRIPSASQISRLPFQQHSFVPSGLASSMARSRLPLARPLVSTSAWHQQPLNQRAQCPMIDDTRRYTSIIGKTQSVPKASLAVATSSGSVGKISGLRWFFSGSKTSACSATTPSRCSHLQSTCACLHRWSARRPSASSLKVLFSFLPQIKLEFPEFKFAFQRLKQSFISA